jgi:hypothetical protein
MKKQQGKIAKNIKGSKGKYYSLLTKLLQDYAAFIGCG